MTTKVKGLLERLSAGEAVVVAEGYLFEFENRGYLKAGGFVPEVVLEHPNLLRDLHREYVHAGSDVVLAFTYYGHREKLRLIGREDDLEKLNRQALKIAREIADETGTLMAGNICNSTKYQMENESIKKEVYDMAKEQIEWAVEEGADFIVGETYMNYEEASLGLKAIKEFGKGLPAVITLAVSPTGLYDGVDTLEALHKLQDEGADVVGFNCFRGPDSMLPLLKEVVPHCKKTPLAALPVAYRTTMENIAMQDLPDIDNPDLAAFPSNLDAWQCTRTQIHEFTRACVDLGVMYVGVCCGSRSGYIRAMAEALGRSPPATRYSPDMSQHYSRMMAKDAYSQEAKWYTQSWTTKIN